MIFLLQLSFKAVFFKILVTVASLQVFQVFLHCQLWICCRNFSRRNNIKKKKKKGWKSIMEFVFIAEQI